MPTPTLKVRRGVGRVSGSIAPDPQPGRRSLLARLPGGLPRAGVAAVAEAGRAPKANLAGPRRWSVGVAGRAGMRPAFFTGMRFASSRVLVRALMADRSSLLDGKA